jgi:hypothetical protein
MDEILSALMALLLWRFLLCALGAIVLAVVLSNLIPSFTAEYCIILVICGAALGIFWQSRADSALNRAGAEEAEISRPIMFVGYCVFICSAAFLGAAIAQFALDSIANGLCFIAFSAFLGIAGFLNEKECYRYRKEYRAAAERAFHATSLRSSDPRFCFEGMSAQVMDDKEVVERCHSRFSAYILTRIAKNDFGEYFWFRFRSDSTPMLKYIEQSRAKFLLKEKYLAPSVSHVDFSGSA